MNYILTSNGITVFLNGKTHSVHDSAHNYKAVVKAVQSNDESALVDALLKTEKQTVAERVMSAGFTFKGDVAFLDGLEVIGALSAKLVRMAKEGYDMNPLVLFVRNLRKNPSRSAVEELYDFLAYGELPITEDGCLLAYKGVQTDYWSCSAGSMVLTKGQVRNGRIYNGVGEEIECERWHVDDDRRKGCSNGLHVGSHNYATGFGSRTVVVKVNPKDVVSVPLDCACQKMRVSAYKVICDYGKEITDAVVKEDATPAGNVEKTLRDAVTACIERLHERGGNVTLKRIQSALKGVSTSVLEIRNVARQAGYTVALDSANPTSVGAMIVL